MTGPNWRDGIGLAGFRLTVVDLRIRKGEKGARWGIDKSERLERCVRLPDPVIRLISCDGRLHCTAGRTAGCNGLTGRTARRG